MLNESAPPGKELKYARLEQERRFLLSGLPPRPSVRDVVITDRYIVGTRLRLRHIVDSGGDHSETTFKLTQKVAAETGPGLITNIYLSAHEFEVLSSLPAGLLRKIRHSIPPFGVDEFQGQLSGLYLAEVEFESKEQSDGFSVPDFAVAEVTSDIRFTGGQLVRSAREEVAAALAEFGVALA